MKSEENYKCEVNVGPQIHCEKVDSVETNDKTTLLCDCSRVCNLLIHRLTREGVKRLHITFLFNWLGIDCDSVTQKLLGKKELIPMIFIVRHTWLFIVNFNKNFLLIMIRLIILWHFLWDFVLGQFWTTSSSVVANKLEKISNLALLCC